MHNVNNAAHELRKEPAIRNKTEEKVGSYSEDPFCR